MQNTGIHKEIAPISSMHTTRPPRTPLLRMLVACNIFIFCFAFRLLPSNLFVTRLPGHDRVQEQTRAVAVFGTAPTFGSLTINVSADSSRQCKRLRKKTAACPVTRACAATHATNARSRRPPPGHHPAPFLFASTSRAALSSPTFPCPPRLSKAMWKPSAA